MKWFLGAYTSRYNQRREIPAHGRPDGSSYGRARLNAGGWDKRNRYSILVGSSGRGQRLEPGPTFSRRFRSC